jgi:FkbM family methyltransferase
MYRLTIYFPLRVREIGINFLALFIKREHIIKVSQKLFNGKALMGVLPDGKRLYYPLDDSKILPIISEIYYKNIYDVRQIENFSSICDVGAHIGVFTLKMSKQAPKSRIIAIEPNPTNFKFLAKNVSINGLADRVKMLNVAAGEKKEKALLLMNYLSRGDASMKEWHNAGSAGRLTINVISLAEILSTTQGCDLMKIDVEGMEHEVLLGLGDQHLKVNALVIEIHIPIIRAADIYAWLDDHDFSITRARKLYDDCLVVEAKRLCA